MAGNKNVVQINENECMGSGRKDCPSNAGKFGMCLRGQKVLKEI
jgi:hypothetical protein